MYDLQLSEDQIAIRDTVRDFVSQSIFPVATRPERLEPFDVPLAMDLIDAAAELGLRTLMLSEESGGAGADTLTCCIVAEELAAGDVDIASVLAHTAALGGVLFNTLMNDEQRQEFLPSLVVTAATTCLLRIARPEWRAGSATITTVRREIGWTLPPLPPGTTRAIGSSTEQDQGCQRACREALRRTCQH